MNAPVTLGATCLGERSCRFLVWAPSAEKVEVHFVEPEERFAPLEREEKGYHQAVVEDAKPGSLYFYRLNGDLERPDPASRFQPHGVHGPSQVTEAKFPWDDAAWPGLPLEDYVTYELHVGAFTGEGTFDAIVPHLDSLRDLGITAVELMPVAQFPGSRNWGYDGVYPFAVQNSYGGPQGLKTLVNACHRKKLAVVLDVVYNHLGPEGNYLADYGPFFTDRYSTLWGPALNFDGPWSDEVRRFFIENALYWVTEFHIDALRLDAVHAILDHSPVLFLEELAVAVHEQAQRLKRKVHVIAESADNNARIVTAPELGGYGLDAQWNDEFHHALHVLLTGDGTGYYEDFGRVEHLAKAFREGFVYSGQYSPYHRRRHGSSSRRIPATRFVVCGQNHDQVGNRMLGERLSQLVPFEALKMAAGIVLLAPFLPLLFMGEEYGETAPFHYFISHSDPELVEAVRAGRRHEFSAFKWQGKPPDPQDEATFEGSKLNHELRGRGDHAILLEFYTELMRLRREVPPLACLSKEQMEVTADEDARVLAVRRWKDGEMAAAIASLNPASVSVGLPLPAGKWRMLLDSTEKHWGGSRGSGPPVLASDGEVELDLQPHAFLVLQLQEGV